MNKTLSKEEKDWFSKHKRYVYFAQSDAHLKPVKIGQTESPERRLGELRWEPEHNHGEEMELLFLIPVSDFQNITLEREIHDLFHMNRLDRGREWFVAPRYELLTQIKRDKYIADWSEMDAFIAKQAA